MRQLTAKITSKGQITIPVEIRRALCATVGDAVTFVLDDDGRVRVERAGEPVARTAGMFAGRREDSPATIAQWHEAAQRAIADEVMKSMDD